MRNLRDVIVRRRPSLGSGTEPETVVQDSVAPPEPPRAHDQPDFKRDIFLDAAREARNHVPKPVRPKIHDQPDWSKSSEAQAGLPEAKPAEPVSAAPEAKATPTAGPAPKIWDLQPDIEDVAPRVIQAVNNAPETPKPVPAAPPVPTQAKQPVQAAPRRASSERVKTRLLGFHAPDVGADVFDAEAVKTSAATPFFPIGWLVVVEGPGRGASFTLTAGLSTIGRDADQTVALDYGDTSISRERHASIAYDPEEKRTYVGHGGKSNIVRLNNKPLLTTEELSDGDMIKIGKTVLRFVEFCGEAFSWSEEADADGTRDD